MHTKVDHRHVRVSVRRAVGLLVVAGLLAACSDDGGSGSTASDTTAAGAAETTAAQSPETTAAESVGTTAAPAQSDTTAAAGDVTVDQLGPPTGEPISVGLVNTEGTPGLDFPDIRVNIEAAVDYLNEHGGMGDRPIELQTCVARGSPETSQACAQELAGKGVELVMLGLDVFPDYKTYEAAGIPVIGLLPILPGDYTANALFLTGGNATVMSAVAQVAKDHFDASSVGIISSDNAGANASAAALEASLGKAGIEFSTVKGGDNETDAGYQGLMREAAEGDPDVLVSLYSDAGCIGTMRGRAALGIEIPVITTGICASKDVIDAVGDDAVGWNFAGVQTTEDTPELAILQEILAPALGVPEEEVDPNGLGLGGLGFLQIMSLAEYANLLAASGGEVTGQALYDFLKSEDGLTLYGTGNTPIECGSVATYPAVCSFIFPFAEYQEGGQVVTVPGLEAVSAKDLLP